MATPREALLDSLPVCPRIPRWRHLSRHAQSGALLLCALLCIPARSEPPGSYRLEGPLLVYSAREGDTLIDLARTYTGNPNNWTLLAARNRIANERTIPIGTLIRIPTHLLVEIPAQAKVSALAGPVLAAHAEDTAAYPLQLGDTLEEGDRIQTGAQGFVTLSLADGSHLTLPSHTQVRLHTLKKTRFTDRPHTTLTLEDGKLEARVAPLRENRGRFEVRTPLAVAAVRGTHFRVGRSASSEGPAVQNEVLEGQVDVRPSARRTPRRMLEAGNGITVNATGTGIPRALLPPPTLLAPERAALHSRPTLNFDLAAQPGAVRYRLQISQDTNGLALLAETMQDTPHLKLDGLADGHYVARFTALDATQLEGYPYTFAFILKARPEPPIALEPKGKFRGQEVDFAWTQSPDATRTRLQLARDAQFADLVWEDTLEHSRTRTPALSPGRYFWRLAAIDTRVAPVDQGPFGDPQPLTLLSGQAAPEVGDTESAQLHLRWSGEAGQVFRIECARDPAFTDLLFAEQSDVPQLDIPRPSPGRYYLRVRATDADGYVGRFSAPQSFVILAHVLDGNGQPIHSGDGMLRPGT